MKNFTKQITNKTLFKPTRWLLMALMLLLGTGSVWGETISQEQVFRLKPSANWKNEGARFAIYFFGNGVEWTSMTDSDGDGIYEGSSPKDKTYTSLIFCRMNPSTTENNWNNKWNQTNDLTFDGYHNQYTVKEGTWDKGGGRWENCISPTVTKQSINATNTNYGTCGLINIVLKGAINAPTYGMLVRYEGVKTANQITAPTDGTTYAVNNELTDGGVIAAYGMTNASQFLNVTIPDVSKIYTFAYYEYEKDCKYYVLAGELYSTTPRTPTVTTDEPTYSGGATATLKGTFVKVGQGAGIEGYGFEWVSKPAGSNLANINKSGSIGVGTTFTADVTFDVSGTYTYKAYINSNASGACEYGYGEEKSITVSVCDQPAFSLQDNVDGKVTVDYTGSAQKPTIKGDVTPTSVKYNGNTYDGNGPTDAGIYTVTVSANASGEFCAVTDKEIGTFVINQIDQPTLTLKGVETTYCTEPNEAITLSTTGGDGNGAVSYQIVNDGTTATASITTNQLSITSAGTLKLKAIKAEDTNFNQAESAVVTVTIYADIEAGSINASTTTVCQGGEVTLTLSGHTADAKITWYADDAQVATDNATYTASNLQKATSYKVEVTRQDGTCDLKTKYTDAFQILVDPTSAISLSSNSEDVCNGKTIDLTKLVSSNTGTVTWYSDETCTEAVVKPESITVNGNVIYYAQAKSGVCAAAKAPYTITAKGVTISQDPATVHPYEVTTFTASNSKVATWELTNNPTEGDDLSADDPVFSGKTTAYITKADGNTTTFKGEAATGYVIKATADDCETTHTFNVEDDPDNCNHY